MFSRNVSSRQVARVTVAVMIGLYAAEWYIYHFVARPEIVGAILFNVTFVLALVSYCRTACTDPGTTQSPEWRTWSSLIVAQASADDTRAGSFLGEKFGLKKKEKPKKRYWAPGETSTCEECKLERPERAHHCKQCGVCILRMDHHCPWVGNCIGWRNHKFFILFCWWSFAATGTWLATLRKPNAVETLQYFLDYEDIRPIAFVIITILLLLVTGGMTAFSVHMAAKNVTSIEELFPGDNPYCFGSSMENIVQLMGPLDYKILLPTFPVSTTFGTSFPIANKAVPTYGSSGV